MQIYDEVHEAWLQLPLTLLVCRRDERWQQIKSSSPPRSDLTFLTLLHATNGYVIFGTLKYIKLLLNGFSTVELVPPTAYLDEPTPNNCITIVDEIKHWFMCSLAQNCMKVCDKVCNTFRRNLMFTSDNVFFWWQEFVEKFRMLLPKGATGTSEHITDLFEKMELDKNNYQIGKTKVNILDHISNLFWTELTCGPVYHQRRKAMLPCLGNDVILSSPMGTARIPVSVDLNSKHPTNDETSRNVTNIKMSPLS